MTQRERKEKRQLEIDKKFYAAMKGDAVLALKPLNYNVNVICNGWNRLNDKYRTQ